MVVNAPDTPVQAQVVFAIEATAANGAYIGELKSNYIIPTLEYFHGGPLEELGGNGSVYCIVTYKSADCLPGVPINTYGPFQTPQGVLEALETIQFYGGHAESKACLTEAMATALACFEELGRSETSSHMLILCCSPPYSAYAGGLAPPGVPATVEGAARLLGERGVQVSVAAARRVPALNVLFEHAGGEFHAAVQRNYAKDPRHLVLLRGYSLKERPPSPAPPPAPDIQTDVYGQRGGSVPTRPLSTVPTAVGPPVGGPGQGPFPRANCGGRGNWLAPPRQPLYATNSALLTQLAQPSHPPPPHHPIQPGHPRMPSMAPQPSTAAPGPAAPPLQRSYIWSGVIEWMEKGKNPNDQQKTTKHLPCQVSASTKDIEPELKVDTWPNKLLMQLMPKQLISSIGGQYLRDSKSVLFHLQPSEALDSLTKVMVNGFAGCVHFSPMSSPPQCDIKVLILLYTPDKKAYLGFIPNNQAMFVDRLRKVIQQQKMKPNMPQSAMPGSSGMGGASGMASGGMAGGGMAGGGMAGGGMAGGGMAGGGMAGGGMAGGSMAGSGMAGGNMGGAGGSMGGSLGQIGATQQMQTQQMQPHQGMMISGNMPQQQSAGKGPRANQLDGLEAARQQNLEKIQHLQQTLEAAHQQEAQFKSQMDIMSHLHAAQQQEQHYKQLEEQQRKHQLQQQIQQQLRQAGGAGPLPRAMRPLHPSNPGLRHLLQQQPQYRPGSTGARPPSQNQSYDDNYVNDFIM